MWLPTDSPGKRLRKVLLLGAGLGLAGLAYGLLCRRLGFGIPCLFNLVTGLQCPGCGVSRMCVSLMTGELAAAWEHNPAILCLLPFGMAVGLDCALRYIRTGVSAPHRWAERLCAAMAGILLVFGVARNF